MPIPINDALNILLAVIIGGLIGAEREFRHRPAGFRTLIFICLGATLFTMLSIRLGGDLSPVRIAAHMVTGVGFICAGVIMQEGVHLVGLTTAATIWIVAAIGMGIGGGQYLLVLLATAAVMAVLWAFPMVEDRIYNVRDKRTYEITSDIKHETVEYLRDSIHECGLRVEGPKLVKSGDKLISIWEVYGSPDQHETLVNQLVTLPEVKSFDY
ncbi:MAG: hypothetical protein AMJ56_06820 [Anaerolineae bacterium SG8_19]|jgi:putative Mg2+ transporter-C (MgtC) family protein|nr:MAG: hypothetical protein AMJ56_06820 [Anaerolineae bacterium SG8_19]